MFASRKTLDALREEYESRLARARREIDALHAQVERLSYELEQATAQLLELQSYARERRIEQLMKSMTYDDLAELLERQEREIVSDEEREAARRLMEDRQRYSEMLQRSIVRVQLRPPRKRRR
jgi:hypothetical protein